MPEPPYELQLVPVIDISSRRFIRTSVGGACVGACACAWSGARCTAGRSFHTTSGVALACLMYDGPEYSMPRYVLWHRLVAQLKKRLIETFPHAAAPSTQGDMCHIEFHRILYIPQRIVAMACEAKRVWPTSQMQWCTDLALGSAAPLWQTRYYMRHRMYGEALLTFK